MRKIIYLVIGLFILSGPWVLCYHWQSQPQTIMVDGVAWNQVMHWDFADGLYPDGWGLGDWRIVDGELEGRESEGEFSIYFLPFTHGGQFILETKFRFVEGLNGDVEVQLLTRDSNEINFESGMVLFAEEKKVTVRHMANRIDYVYRPFSTNLSIDYGEWYVMRFMVYNGTLRAIVNEAEVYCSKESYPVGEYHEPHLAVRNAIARFEYVKILVPSS